MEMIKKHEPINRIFDVIDINALTAPEVTEFFQKSFQSVQIGIESEAMEELTQYSSGMPKIMHEIGDAAFWIDTDGVIDRDDAFRSLIVAADAIGKKYVDQQVYDAIRSKDYHSILNKIVRITSMYVMTFSKERVFSVLTEPEKQKYSNFLKKMRELNVIRKGDVQGEYIFNIRMVLLYIRMQSQKKK